MATLYNRYGIATGEAHDGVIESSGYLGSISPAGIVHDSNGRYVGHIVDNWLVDANGRASHYVEEASGPAAKRSHWRSGQNRTQLIERSRLK